MKTQTLASIQNIAKKIQQAKGDAEGTAYTGAYILKNKETAFKCEGTDKSGSWKGVLEGSISCNQDGGSLQCPIAKDFIFAGYLNQKKDRSFGLQATNIDLDALIGDKLLLPIGGPRVLGVMTVTGSFTNDTQGEGHIDGLFYSEDSSNPIYCKLATDFSFSRETASANADTANLASLALTYPTNSGSMISRNFTDPQIRFSENEINVTPQQNHPKKLLVFSFAQDVDHASLRMGDQIRNCQIVDQDKEGRHYRCEGPIDVTLRLPENHFLTN